MCVLCAYLTTRGLSPPPPPPPRSEATAAATLPHLPEAEEEEKEERREGEAKGNSDFFSGEEGGKSLQVRKEKRGREKICAKKSFCTACYRKLRDNGVVRKVL